jgi:hypothetical protein
MFLEKAIYIGVAKTFAGKPTGNPPFGSDHRMSSKENGWIDRS